MRNRVLVALVAAALIVASFVAPDANERERDEQQPTTEAAPTARSTNAGEFRFVDRGQPFSNDLDPDLVVHTTRRHRKLDRAMRILRNAGGDSAALCDGDRLDAQRLAAEAKNRSAKTDNKIAILSNLDPRASLDSVATVGCESQWNHLQYARRHGYDLLWDGPEDMLADGRSPQWSKIASLHRWLPHYDWVLWVCAETLFLNQSISVEHVVRVAEQSATASGRRAADIGLIAAAETHMVSAGVLLLRGAGGRAPPSAAAERSMEFLRAVYHYPNASDPRHDARNFMDQGPINFLLYGYPQTDFALRSNSGWAVLVNGELLNAKPHASYPVPLADPHPARTLVVHFAAFSYFHGIRSLWVGVAGFARMAARAAMNFAVEDAMTVDACCVFQKRLHERRQAETGAVGPPSQLSLPEPRPALLAQLRAAMPPWNTDEYMNRWGFADHKWRENPPPPM